MNTNIDIDYEYERLKYHSIMVVERILRELGIDVRINGFSLKIQNEKTDVGEIEIEYDKESMIVKIKIFSVEDNPETAIEIGMVKSIKNFYNEEFYSMVRFY